MYIYTYTVLYVQYVRVCMFLTDSYLPAQYMLTIPFRKYNIVIHFEQNFTGIVNKRFIREGVKKQLVTVSTLFKKYSIFCTTTQAKPVT